MHSRRRQKWQDRQLPCIRSKHQLLQQQQQQQLAVEVMQDARAAQEAAPLLG
jgi:hypothetical protein